MNRFERMEKIAISAEESAKRIAAERDQLRTEVERLKTLDTAARAYIDELCKKGSTWKKGMEVANLQIDAIKAAWSDLIQNVIVEPLEYFDRMRKAIHGEAQE